MNVAQPHSDVIPGARGLLLAGLVQLKVPVSVRALARRAEVSPQRALEVVHDLADAGIVHTRRSGPSLLVWLNRDHLAAEPTIALVGIRARLVDRLRGELRGWEGLAGGWLYGSIARGEGGRDSDVDVVLVSSGDLNSRHWVEASARLRNQVEAWTGNALQLIEHSVRSFSDLVDGGNPLIAALRRDGVPITDEAYRLLAGAA